MPVLGVIVTGALVAVAGRLVLWEAPQVRRRAVALLLLALIVLGVSLVGAAQAHASTLGNLVSGGVVVAVGVYLMWAALWTGPTGVQPPAANGEDQRLALQPTASRPRAQSRATRRRTGWDKRGPLVRVTAWTVWFISMLLAVFLLVPAFTYVWFFVFGGRTLPHDWGAVVIAWIVSATVFYNTTVRMD